MRYHADGSLDTGFGNAGVVAVSPIVHLQAPGLALQANGDLVLAGAGETSGSTTATLDGFEVRLTP